MQTRKSVKRKREAERKVATAHARLLAARCDELRAQQHVAASGIELLKARLELKEATCSGGCELMRWRCRQSKFEDVELVCKTCGFDTYNQYNQSAHRFLNKFAK